MYLYTHIYTFHTCCTERMHTEFMVTGCLWGVREGKRTEKVNKEDFQLKVFVTISLIFVWLFKNSEFRGKIKLEKLF